MLVCVSLHNFAHETAGAARIRHSPRPLLIQGANVLTQTSGELSREMANACLSMHVYQTSLRGALATKQSISPRKGRMDCFVASAPLRKRFAFVAGNDGVETSATLHPRRPGPSAQLRTRSRDDAL
jgi:hypothetical protein